MGTKGDPDASLKSHAQNCFLFGLPGFSSPAFFCYILSPALRRQT
jgi:hypothetical protein